MFLKRSSSGVSIIWILVFTLFLGWGHTSNCDDIFKCGTFTKDHLKRLREETRSLFLHGWNSYMEFGYPADEVKPISCAPYGPNYENSMDLRNDVLGNYSSTLLDSIDTFIVMGDREGFAKYIKYVENISFDINSTVQVFETSIRALGSLLTCHLYASDEKKGFKVEGYNNSLLLKAYDLGQRLLPAYETKTGVPFARINLKYGMEPVHPNLFYETCTAGAGSPMLEMTLLSKLTGVPIFEEVSKNAFMTLWESRSTLDLIPMNLDPQKGKWLLHISGIGASIDSFFEYALKGAILFDDVELFNVWESSYKALSIHSKNDWFFSNVVIDSGFATTQWIDSLSAFFPGLLVLAGKIEDAVHVHTLFLKLWNTFASIPERWVYLGGIPSVSRAIALEWYPLRPEFIESTYYLYRATKDPLYLQIGVRILKDYKESFKAKCGFAGMQDIRSGDRQDRMESFVLSETLKYLYLLFDEDNPIHKDSSNIIFSTEGHPMWLDQSLIIPYEQVTKNDKEELMQNWAFNELQKPAYKKISSGGVMNSIDDFIKKFIKHHKTDRKALLTFKQQIFRAKLERVSMAGIQNYGLILIDEDFNDANKCCDADFFKGSGFFSELISWEKFYEIDDKYRTTLLRPWYLEHNYSNLELENRFYDRWADYKRNQCKRRQTSEVTEILFGDKNDIRYSQADEIKLQDVLRYNKYLSNNFIGHDPKVKPGDFWVPTLSGIRARIETLKVGYIDSSNSEITETRVKEVRNRSLIFDLSDVRDLDGLCDAKERPKFLRIITLNGKKVPQGAVVWVSEQCVSSKTKQLPIKMGKGNAVLIDNDPIENMFIWTQKV